MKTILVTGGCGWLGSEVVRTLLARGDSVVAADIVSTPAMQAMAKVNSNLRIQVADLGEWHQVLRLFQDNGIGAVIHTAAIVGVIQGDEAPIRALRANVEGTVNLLEAMRLHQVKRMVHVSSEETYGDFLAPTIDEDHPQKPLSVYGLTKLAAEHYGRVYSRNYGLDCINIRTCWVYGPAIPRLRMPRTFIEAALRGEPYRLEEGGDFAVDQTYITDTVQGILLALDKARHNFDSYNIASGLAPTIGDTANAVVKAIPGARITVGKGREFPVRGTLLNARKGALDIRRAERELGYRPQFDIQRGIEATIAATRIAFGET